MTRGRSGLSLALLLVGAISLTANRQQRFTSKTIGVRVDVLVTNGHQLVRGLSARDFELRDDGVVQSVSEVDVEGMPLNLILGFDTSESVAGERMHHLLEAGNALLAGLQPQDRVALLSFASRVRLLAPLTPSRQQIRGALSLLKAEGATSLRDAAFAALALREEDPGRTLVLIFSDGADTSSWLRAAPVIEAAKRTDAVVYAVAIAGERTIVTMTTPMRSAETNTGTFVTQTTKTTVEEAGKFLEKVTEETGGRVLFANANSDLRATFEKTLAEFRDRYVLSYVPTGVSTTGWHRLDVKLKGKSGKVTGRRGYFAE
jgi:VWFA-related protein